MQPDLRWAILLFAFLVGMQTEAYSDEYPIAGISPYQRPAGAPVIQNVTKGKVWYGQALTGVSKPYPASLSFLEDQGNWYTPFIHPGMTGRYDIRGWHKTKQ